jgi:hypothetical protein
MAGEHGTVAKIGGGHAAGEINAAGFAVVRHIAPPDLLAALADTSDENTPGKVPGDSAPSAQQT